MTVSFSFQQLTSWLKSIFPSHEGRVLNKVKEWLEEEVSDYQEHADDIGDVDSFDDGILEGRHECAEGLINQIKKWKKELGIETS